MWGVGSGVNPRVLKQIILTPTCKKVGFAIFVTIPFLGTGYSAISTNCVRRHSSSLPLFPLFPRAPVVAALPACWATLLRLSISRTCSRLSNPSSAGLLSQPVEVARGGVLSAPFPASLLCVWGSRPPSLEKASSSSLGLACPNSLQNTSALSNASFSTAELPGCCCLWSFKSLESKRFL